MRHANTALTSPRAIQESKSLRRKARSQRTAIWSMKPAATCAKRFQLETMAVYWAGGQPSEGGTRFRPNFRSFAVDVLSSNR
jgi:hypothetical protein